ncbi:MAG TPA: phasin family protein [Roseiflexaceae bacterium]|nr:phasin family protein [Roseiflexaceae bacterium]
MATEEVEVTVEQVDEPAPASGGWMFDGVRRMLLASVGAMALSLDEAERFIARLVERGELAQKDGEKLINEFQDRMYSQRPPIEKIGERVEQGVEEILNRFHVPSRRDIDALSTQIAQLSARIEELTNKQ